MNLKDFLDNIFHPREMQRLEEYPCSICGKSFDFIEKQNPTLDGFIDPTTQLLVHNHCREEYYATRNLGNNGNTSNEIPLTIDELEELACK